MELGLINAKHRKKKHELTPLTVIMLTILILYTIIIFALLLWGFVNALKGTDEWRGIGMTKNRVWFPMVWKDYKGNLCFVNNLNVVFKYSTKLVGGTQTVGMMDMVWNSILYCLGSALIGTLVPFVTAYLCAKYDNPISKILVTVVLITMAVPVVGSEPAAIKLTYDLGMYNQVWGMWILKANFLGLYFLVFHAAFKSQPKAYHEAALIDGASDWRIMTRISMPLCVGEFSTILLIYFINFWNDYQTPMLYMPDKPTLSWNTFHFANLSESEVTTPVVLMSAIIVMIPALVLFLIFQKRLLKNVNVGGIKG